VPEDFLDKILFFKSQDNARKKAYRENIRGHLAASRYSRYGIFKKQISRPGAVHLIAEIKKASPSRGVIRDDFNPEVLAGIYEQSGAAAISVLTEENYFLGKAAYLKSVSENYHTPTLMKDFIIDELQIYEGRYCGASAVLLIAAILQDDQLIRLSEVARSLDMDTLVEVHDEAELDRAVRAGAEIIGVNNRNLRSFEVDLGTSERLIPLIPEGRVAVAESGIRGHDDIKRLAAAGAHAVLIGETFLKERDVAGKIKEVMYG
jgi:indole-3-glycerol phosphate synthase